MKKRYPSTLLLAIGLTLPAFLTAQSNASHDCDGVDDQVVVENGSAAFVGATEYTLSCWVYPTNAAPAYPDFDGFAGIRNEFDAAFYLLQISPATTVEGRFQNSDGSEFTLTFGGLALNTWQHLALVYDGAELAIWHDGDLVATEPAFGAITNGTVPFHIGNVQFNTVPFLLDGRVDEVALFRRALNTAEIGCLASGAPDPTDTDLAFYFDMNEGVPNGNNTTITALTDQVDEVPAGLEGFALTGSTSNFVESPVLGSVIQEALCEGGSYLFNGETLTEPGAYTATFQATSGCDSTVVLELVVAEVDNGVVQNGSTIIATATEAEYQWYVCGTSGNTLIQGATAQYYQAPFVGQFAVEVTQDGCSALSECVTVSAIGIEERQAPLLTLSPVPAGDVLTVELSRPTQQVLLTVVDMTGREVITRAIGSARKANLDVAALRPGAYFLRVQADGLTRVVRFVRG
ncbi:MAG: LamG-like jellyroll fold domain-containing protein [Flavobacteriales bacterium]